MPHFPNFTIGQQYLDDVKAEFRLGILQQAEIVERGLGEQPFFARVHGGGGTRPVLGGTGLHFHKHQAIGIAEDEVNLAAIGAEVGGEELQADFLEVLLRRPLAKFTASQVLGFFRFRKKRFDARGQIHPGARDFDCRSLVLRVSIPASLITQRKTETAVRPVERSCPVCDSSTGEPHWQKGELHIVRCRDCGMVFVNPAPAGMASGVYYDTEGADYYLSPAKLESDYADVRFERELKLFREFCPRGAVLDVGCGSGAFLFQLRKRWPADYEIVGTDVSGAPLDYAESRSVPVLRGDFLEMDFGGRRFEGITLWAVAEHLAEPKRFLTKAHELLNPSGVCFVLVPNLRSLAVRLLGAKYRYVYAQHLNYFSAQTLARLSQAVGFNISTTRFMHFNPVVIWQDWRGGGRDVTNAERGDLLRRTTTLKQKSWLGPVKWIYGQVEKSLAAFSLADNVVLVLRKS